MNFYSGHNILFANSIDITGSGGCVLSEAIEIQNPIGTDLLQLAGMTFRARGRRSSKDASNTTACSSGYDITAQVAVMWTNTGAGSWERGTRKKEITKEKIRVRTHD